MGIIFGRLIGNYLGYRANSPVMVKSDALDKTIFSSNVHVMKPPMGYGDEKTYPISNIFVYTNIVKRSRAGSQYTNLLEVIPFNAFSKQNSVTIYKDVSLYDIQSIKIHLTDEFGKSIPFLDNTYVGVDLHFRPKI